MKGVIKIATACMELDSVQNLILDEFSGLKFLQSNDEAIVLLEVEHPDIEMYCMHEVILSEDHRKIISISPEVSYSVEPKLIDY